MAEETAEPVVRLSRMEAFSDGVFAIAITLLVLELSVPEGSEGHLLSAVLSLWPAYLAYIVSFATIGATWLGHSSITHYMHGANTTFLTQSRPTARGLISPVSHQVAGRVPGLA